MKLVVIGATGQVARSLVERAALWPDLSVPVLARPEIDLADPASVAAIGAIEADVVINAAAYTAVDRAEDEPDLAFRVNAAAAGELAAAARRGGARFVQISTDYVFDGEAEGAYTEDTPTNPLGVYGRSKLAGERAVREADPDATIVRTAWVYSPFGHNFLRTMMRLALDRDRISVVDDQLGNPTSALDLADGLLTMIARWRNTPESAGSGLYHLAGGETTSWAGFAEQIFAEGRKRGLATAEVDRIHSDAWPAKAPRPRDSAMDSNAFERDFGFTMPEWRTSLTGMIDRVVRMG